MSDYLVQMNIRVTPGLRSTIADLAWERRQSVNQLIVEQLENLVRERLLNEK